MRTRLLPIAVVLVAMIPAGDAAAAAWGPPHSLNAHGGVYGLSVALGDRGRVGAAFVRDSNGNRRVELRRGTAKGLGRPVILDRSKHAIGDTALAFDRYNRSVAAWRRYVGGNPRGNHRVWMSSMDSHGAVLGPYQLTYEHESAYDPRFVHGADGQLLLHWNRRSFASFAPWEATERSSGPGLRVRLPQGAVFDVSLAVEADRSVVAVWPKNGRIGPQTSVRSRLIAPDLIRGDIRTLSGSDRVVGGGYGPALAVGADGRAIVGWLTESYRARYALRTRIG